MKGNGEASADAMGRQDHGGRLSYKFQRLREQIRRSVLSGEFDRRLPGERELGRKYKANAKTINKALCDLTSEGLLVRHIGRGTFVAGRKGGQACPSVRRRFLCMLPKDEADPPPYRRILLGHFGERLTQGGHLLNVVAVLPDPVRQDIPLKAWAPSIRSSTDGLVAYPRDPLSGGASRLGDDCVSEALRRHVPTVSLGGFAGAAKIDAVVPDYVAGGFRLAEYLSLLGCAKIIVVLTGEGSRETELVVSGIRMAAGRYRRSLFRTVIADTMPPHILERQLDAVTAGLPGADKGDSSLGIGVICIGGVSLQALLRSRSPHGPNLAERAAIACLPEPGDTTAEEAGLTAYEVDPRRIGLLGADLIAAAKPGRMPVEIVIPGELKIRGAAARRSAELGPNGIGPASRTASAMDEGMPEITI